MIKFRKSKKKTFRDLRENPIFKDSKKVKLDRLRNNLISKTKHPSYSKIKGKVPYAVFSPFTELARLATYRVAGLTSAPFIISALIGFSILEMSHPHQYR